MRLNSIDEGKTSNGRLHKATYSSDKKKGGYLVRVEGPTAERFLGREVPVSTRAGDEHTEKLIKLVWTGTDTESGKPVALYQFEPRPKDEAEEVPF